MAKRFDLASLASLEANVSLALIDPRRTRVRAYGTICAGGLEQNGPSGPLAALQVDAAPFETFFIDEELDGAGAYDSDDDETYDEAIEDGFIDTGELVAQHLYLWLSEHEQTLIRESSSEYAAGEVVLDSDNVA